MITCSKPFSPRELVARVKAQLRRQDWARGTPKRGLDLQEDALRAVYEGAAADLTRVEFRILSALLAQEGVILSRDQLIAAAYEDHRVVKRPHHRHAHEEPSEEAHGGHG